MDCAPQINLQKECLNLRISIFPEKRSEVMGNCFSLSFNLEVKARL